MTLTTSRKREWWLPVPFPSTGPIFVGRFWFRLCGQRWGLWLMWLGRGMPKYAKVGPVLFGIT